MQLDYIGYAISLRVFSKDDNKKSVSAETLNLHFTLNYSSSKVTFTVALYSDILPSDTAAL
jgi:hypothetical protein